MSKYFYFLFYLFALLAAASCTSRPTETTIVMPTEKTPLGSMVKRATHISHRGITCSAGCKTCTINIKTTACHRHRITLPGKPAMHINSLLKEFDVFAFEKPRSLTIEDKNKGFLFDPA